VSVNGGGGVPAQAAAPDAVGFRSQLAQYRESERLMLLEQLKREVCAVLLLACMLLWHCHALCRRSLRAAPATLTCRSGIPLRAAAARCCWHARACCASTYDASTLRRR
jgi:hypothetical protein